ncbi:putative DNA base hypermodification protein, partial [Mariniblastus sp.]|nr:putative DNA base hypermodification protein [Mariniblastus sp.]
MSTKNQSFFWPIESTAKKRRKPFSSLAPAKPTKVFDTYWRFAVERQSIFFRRIEGRPYPWTDDDIFLTYKFTNAYRASDRVSQYLIRNVIYEGSQETDEVFFRTILFKLFNKIETWELLQSKLGEISYREYSYARYNRILTKAMDSKQTIYSAAYIMPSGAKRKLNGSKKKTKKH